jgi:hypothetical protein
MKYKNEILFQPFRLSTIDYRLSTIDYRQNITLQSTTKRIDSS